MNLGQLPNKEVNMEKCYKRSERTYIVYFKEDGREVFIGTPGCLSILASELLCDLVMSPLNWELTHTYEDLMSNGHFCIGVGYKVPDSVCAEEAIDKLFS